MSFNYFRSIVGLDCWKTALRNSAIAFGILIIAASVISSLPEPERDGDVNMAELLAKMEKKYDYIQQNTNWFNERSYSAVIKLAKGDPEKAIEIFNDPDYPQKFYDESGYLPGDQSRAKYPDILKRVTDTHSYIKENTDYEFDRVEYSAVMRLSKADPVLAVEIFNDPGFPEKYYDTNGALPERGATLVNYSDILKQATDRYSYIKENSNYEFNSEEYSAAVRLSSADPVVAVEILNDPGFPEKYYDEYGRFPWGSQESSPELLKRLSDTYSYIKENTDYEFDRVEYSAVMILSKADPVLAVEILNDPGFPEKYYDTIKRID